MNDRPNIAEMYADAEAENMALQQDMETIVDAVAAALGLDGGDIDGDGDQGGIIANFVNVIARERDEAVAALVAERAQVADLRADLSACVKRGQAAIDRRDKALVAERAEAKRWRDLSDTLGAHVDRLGTDNICLTQDLAAERALSDQLNEAIEPGTGVRATQRNNCNRLNIAGGAGCPSVGSGGTHMSAPWTWTEPWYVLSALGAGVMAASLLIAWVLWSER